MTQAENMWIHLDLISEMKEFIEKIGVAGCAGGAGQGYNSAPLGRGGGGVPRHPPNPLNPPPPS